MREQSAVRDGYLQAAASAAVLLAEPAVASAWDDSSELEEFSVRGLAGHLASQVFAGVQAIAAPPVAESPLTLLDYYDLGAWRGAGINEEINVWIRDRGEELAASGAENLAAQARDAVRQLRDAVSTVPPDRIVSMGGRPLRFDDFLVTRMMEIAVHSDDLALSVGIATPALPSGVCEFVVDLLTRLAVRRHGQVSVLRALSRAERAPSTIAAI